MTTTLTQTHLVAEKVLAGIRAQAVAPNSSKELGRRLNALEVGELVGKSKHTIYKGNTDLIESGVMSPLIGPKSSQARYGVAHVRQLQEHFGTAPRRDPEIDECLVLGVASLKGGVGKSTIALYLAQHFATKGYRVALIDMDNQASTTASFGYIPDIDIVPEQTVLPFFEGATESLEYALMDTYWPGLQLIPTNLTAFNMEWSLAEQMMKAPNQDALDELLSLLQDGVNSIRHLYDIIIIDSPPNLGTTMMNILRAADALVVPTPARLLDYSSTVQFLNMVSEHSQNLGISSGYKFVKLAVTLYEGRENKGIPNSQMNYFNMMQQTFGQMIMKRPFNKMAEIENAASSMRTVFEDERPDRRAMSMLVPFCEELESYVLSTWPSKQKDAHNLLKKSTASLDQAAASTETASA